MKTFICVLLLVASVAAEPPHYRSVRLRSLKQESHENTKESPKTSTEEISHAAAGNKSSQELKLPSHHEVSSPAHSFQLPEDSYSAPFKIHAGPYVEYGVPEIRKGEQRAESKEKKVEKHEGGKTEHAKEGKEKKEKLKEETKPESDVEHTQGSYFVLLPGPELQRVQFETENDVRNMAYTARLQYKSEDHAPLFVYTAVPQFQSAPYISEPLCLGK